MDDSLPHDRSRNTPRSSGDVQDRSLLAVFAHPDPGELQLGQPKCQAGASHPARGLDGKEDQRE